MNTWHISMIVIAVIIIGLAIVMAIRARRTNERPNYRAWFIIGICYIPIGVSTKNPFFYIIGAAFVIISLVNKDKWRQEKKWDEHTPAEKALKIVLLCIVAVMLIAMVVLFFLRRKLII